MSGFSCNKLKKDNLLCSKPHFSCEGDFSKIPKLDLRLDSSEILDVTCLAKAFPKIKVSVNFKFIDPYSCLLISLNLD